MSVPNKRKTSASKRSKTPIAPNQQMVVTEAVERLKTREQFAEELNICSRTMKKYLKEADYKLPKALIKVADQERIRQIVLGIPNHSN